MNLELSTFASYPRDETSRLCEIQTHTPKDLLKTHGQFPPLVQHIDDWDNIYEGAAFALQTFEELDLDPLLADLYPDATGTRSESAWSAVFATQDLVDHLGIGTTDNPEVYERHFLNVIYRTMLEFDLVGHPDHFGPFYYQSERADRSLALGIRKEFKPPAAVIDLEEDFRPTERENNYG